jgi:hypothetical protein
VLTARIGERAQARRQRLLKEEAFEFVDIEVLVRA